MNDLKIYIEQYIGDNRLSIVSSISGPMVELGGDDAIIKTFINTLNRFKYEKEIELDNLKYAPKPRSLESDDYFDTLMGIFKNE